jgi:predicted enzyme related to lactoylglutathione lyase
VTISHMHCHVTDLAAAIRWFRDCCTVEPTFSDARMAVLPFGGLDVILNAAAADSVATLAFRTTDCDGDCAAMMARGASVLEAPEDRPFGARVAYLKGPGGLTIELEQTITAAV